MKPYTKLFLKGLAVVLFIVFLGMNFYDDLLYNETETPIHIDNLIVRFMDVGQGDCEIIQLPDGRNIIIDGGPNRAEDELVEKIQDYGITKFDYVIATHPHDDHIGGLDIVLNYFDVGCVYMTNAVSNSDNLENMLNIIENKNIKTVRAKAGQKIIDDEHISLSLVSPTRDTYNEINNYSIVARLRYGNRSFLFTGDAEDFAEELILRDGADIDADVLKVGHHGSSTSTTRKFLNRVNPKYAVIEVGEDNRYGHPHEETKNKLTGITTYRTDVHGDITMVCDGDNIEITTENSEDNDD